MDDGSGTDGGDGSGTEDVEAFSGQDTGVFTEEQSGANGYSFLCAFIIILWTSLWIT